VPPGGPYCEIRMFKTLRLPTFSQRVPLDSTLICHRSTVTPRLSQGQMPALPVAANTALIEALGEQYRECLRGVLQGAKTVALVDFPNYPNVGDSLIWLGQLAALRSLGVRVGYMCTAETFSQSRLEQMLPADAPILFSGGGNLGDLYPRIQQFRLRVLQEFPQHPFVQLPQSIHFSQAPEAEAFFSALRSHGRATLMVRDQPSRALASAHGVAALICPDAAFCLGPLRRHAPTAPVVALLRTDSEGDSSFNTLLGDLRADAVDWLRIAPHGFHSWLYDLTYLTPTRRLYPFIEPFHRNIYALLAAARLADGRRILSRGDVVVTDRLHAHVLCLLLGIPHVILDNFYGKIANFYQQWTAPSPLVCPVESADTLESAIQRAQSLAR
jgi:exopolysaccharide biosynthesis predicted pyruvyltransferase EpsI